MHDPSVLVISIRRPWPQLRRLDRPVRKPAPGSWLAGLPRWRRLLHRVNSPFWRFGRTELYWPSLIDVWHDEPGGRDALEVCRARISVAEYRQSWRYRLDPRVKRHSISEEAALAGSFGYREWVNDNRWKWHLRHMRIRVKFNDDMAVDGYELLHEATARSTRPHDHPLPANATPTLAEAIQAAHADHVREHDR